MKEPWEVFWEVCTRDAFAVRRAADATVRHLRDGRGWTWVGARVVAGRLTAVALSWMQAGGTDPSALRTRLRDAWNAARDVVLAEAQRRRLTDSVLAGGETSATAGNGGFPT